MRPRGEARAQAPEGGARTGRSRPPGGGPPAPATPPSTAAASRRSAPPEGRAGRRSGRCPGATARSPATATSTGGRTRSTRRTPIIETDPPAVMTRVPRDAVPAGRVNVHGHVHNHAPPGGAPHSNVRVGHTDYLRFRRARSAERRGRGRRRVAVPLPPAIGSAPDAAPVPAPAAPARPAVSPFGKAAGSDDRRGPPPTSGSRGRPFRRALRTRRTGSQRSVPAHFLRAQRDSVRTSVRPRPPPGNAAVNARATPWRRAFRHREAEAKDGGDIVLVGWSL